MSPETRLALYMAGLLTVGTLLITGAILTGRGRQS